MSVGAGIAHLELGVRRLSRSREFWSGVMGLDEVTGPGASTVGPAVAWFAAGPSLVKLVEVGAAGDAGGWVDDDLQGGMRHAGFRVGDVDAAVRRLEAAGVEVLVPPVDALGGVRIAFFLDPDGARLELVQGQLCYQHVESPALVAAEVARRPRREDGPRFDHVGVTVPDLAAALEFWCDEAGFEVVGHLRHQDDERGFLMTYVTAAATVVELFSFDVATTPAPTTPAERLGLRGVAVTGVDHVV